MVLANGNGGSRVNNRMRTVRTGMLAGVIFFVALNLRPAIIAVGPILSDIGADLGWGESLLGLLGALPLLAFAAVSCTVGFLTKRFETDKVLFASLLVLAAGCLLRSAFGQGALWAGTVAIGAAIAVGNVLAPTIVKRDYPDCIPIATGAYSACVTLGSAIAGLSASCAEEALGGWREALSIWAAPALLAAFLWLMRMRKRPALPHAARQKHTTSREDERPATAPKGELPLWRRPSTYAITLFMGLQSAVFYTLCTWIPSFVEANGATSAEAGVQLFLFQAIGILSGLLIPRFMYVGGNQICAGLLASLPLLAASLGWLVAPGASLAWSVLGGIGQGASLVVALTLISLRGTTHDETVALSGIAQSFGYLLASGGPSLFGFIAEASAGFSSPLAFMVALGALQCVVALFAGRDGKART